MQLLMHFLKLYLFLKYNIIFYIIKKLKEKNIDVYILNDYSIYISWKKIADSTSKNNSLERSDKKSPAHSSTYETDLDHPSQDGQRGRSNDTTKSDRSPLIITENVSATPKKGRFGVVRKIFGQTLTGEHNLHHPNMIRHSNTQGAAPRPGSLHGDT